MLVVQITGDGLRRFQQLSNDLGSAKARRVYSMALNKTIGTVNTSVKRAVATQMGVTQKVVVNHGGMKILRSSAANLNADINVAGRHLPLKDFRPVQGRKGVTAGPWNNRQLFDGTFINRGRRALTGVGPIQRAKAGGHVFKNTGKFNKASGRNNAIKALWGPSVPVEVVKDESAKTFYRIAGDRMPLEVNRALKAISKGALS